MIQTQGLHIGYSESILSMDDLHLSNGVHILIGRNGSGKSTFLKTLAGQIPKIMGSIKIQNNEVSAISIEELPKIISFVSSQFPIVEFLRVSEFVGLGRNPHTNFFGKKTNKDIEAIDKALETLGISYLRDRFTLELSDGEKQLVSIAKALTQETAIIALDEPTAFLDYSNKKLVLGKLVAIGQEFNKCILLSSHDLDLSLDVNCPFLVIDDTSKTIRFIEPGISKSELIKIAFD
jgi:iron complex transport system ATP-binding protein|tara:strand:+ start:1925 stop:2629 length:705 start_codon:yes stop_codon:yes gene_type:complete